MISFTLNALHQRCNEDAFNVNKTIKIMLTQFIALPKYKEINYHEILTVLAYVKELILTSVMKTMFNMKYLLTKCEVRTGKVSLKSIISILMELACNPLVVCSLFPEVNPRLLQIFSNCLEQCHAVI